MRVINYTDEIMVPIQLSALSEIYEEDMWHHFMQKICYGYILIDVGAHIGLYTVASAKRVGHAGRVFAFEPDKDNADILKALVKMNGVSDRVEIIPAALYSKDGVVPFVAGNASNSHISNVAKAEAQMVPCWRLDTIFKNIHIDILKIDVEGYEERVLEGSATLLSDERNKPKFIYIEVHPYVWPMIGCSDKSLFTLLRNYGYQVFNFRNHPIEQIKSWRRVFAHKT